MAVAAAAQGGYLQRGIPSEPSSVDPHFARDVYEMSVVQDLFTGLTMLGPDGRPVPAAAASWTVSADGTTWTFDLRSDLVWSDGSVLTADDFEASFRRLFDPATASPVAYLLYLIENGEGVNSGRMPVERLGVRALNARRLEIRLVEPAPFLPALLAHTSAVAVPLGAITRHGAAWTRPANFVGNGAFTLAEWRINDRLVLDRNPRYFGAAAVHLPGVVYNVVPDIETALNRFRAGELHVNRGFPASKVDWLRRELPNEIRVTPQLALFYLVLNLRRPGLNDPRVRSALSMVIERELIGAKVQRFGNPAAYGLVPQGVSDYPIVAEPAFKSWTAVERRRRARELLAEAGFGPDKPLEITLQYSSSRGEKRVPIVVGSMWREIGVKVRYSMMEFRVLMDQLQTGNFDVVPIGWLADYDDASAFLLMLATRSSANYGGYSSPVFDGLLAAAARTDDPQSRARLLLEAERILVREQPIIPLTFYVSTNLVSDTVLGWRENMLNFNPSQYLSLRPDGRTQ